MNRNAIIGIILAILIIGGAVVLATQSNKEETPPAISETLTTGSNADTAAGESSIRADETTSSGTISYTNEGFSPKTLTLSSGGKLTVKNDSSSPLQFDSDPHPEHTKNPELNIGRINPGENQTITVTTTGTHGYHNHLNSSDTGSIQIIVN